MELKQWEFNYIKHLMYQEAAFVVEEEKIFSVETRLRTLAKDEGFESMGELISKLRAEQDPGLLRRLVDRMTNHETLFFRDPYLFEALADEVIPELMETNRESQSLDIWSAACSSGQEVYSVAILLLEKFPELRNWNVKLLASDVSDEMVTRCQEGRFSKIESERGLEPDLLARYFVFDGQYYQAVQSLRDMVSCKQINLAGIWPHVPKVDLLLLRNVLIYFDLKTKQKVLRSVRNVLAPNGYLVLGGGETTLNVDDSFEKERKGRAILYRTASEEVLPTLRAVGDD